MIRFKSFETLAPQRSGQRLSQKRHYHLTCLTKILRRRSLTRARMRATMRMSDDKLFSCMQAIWRQAQTCCEGCRARSFYQTCQMAADLSGVPVKEVWDRCLDLDNEAERHTGPYPAPASTMFVRVH